jgi:hypothetical protein
MEEVSINDKTTVFMLNTNEEKKGKSPERSRKKVKTPLT